MSIMNIDLEGKIVVLKQQYLAEGIRSGDHPFRCEHGFGLRTFTVGQKITGVWLTDGEVGTITRDMVFRLATSEEIRRATQKRNLASTSSHTGRSTP